MYGVLHDLEEYCNLRNKRFRRTRDIRASISQWLLKRPCQWHSPHCGESHCHLFASQLQGTAELPWYDLQYMYSQ